MDLISLPVSPFAARVRIAIYAKDLPVNIVPPPSGWPDSRQFRDLNPTGRVPVLLDDRRPLGVLRPARISGGALPEPFVADARRSL